MFSDDEDEDYDEEGEGDMDEPTPEELAYLKSRGIDPKDFARAQMGDLDCFEGGEDDMEDFEDESESEEPAGKTGKRQKQ